MSGTSERINDSTTNRAFWKKEQSCDMSRDHNTRSRDQYTIPLLFVDYLIAVLIEGIQQLLNNPESCICGII